LAQNNVAQPRLQNLSDRMTSRKRTACLLSTVQNGGNDVRILRFFGDEFHEENLHFRG